MILELPYPPSVNHYWGTSGKRRFVGEAGLAFREVVTGIMLANRVRPIEGPVALSVILHPPDARRRDIDNVLKGLCDSLKHGGAYADDSQIVKLTIERREKREGGATFVMIEPHQPEAKT